MRCSRRCRKDWLFRFKQEGGRFAHNELVSWRIELVGSGRLSRNGETVKLRTGHQFLLLARLAAHHPEPLQRSETAALLWPEATPSNGASYLRRALMELRKLGLPLLSEGTSLALEGGEFSIDLGEIRQASEGAAVDEDQLLVDIDHPIASEIRELWGRHLQARLEYSNPEARPGPQDRLKMWLADRMIENAPEAVLEMLSKLGREMNYNKPLDGLLEFYLDMLGRTDESTPAKARVKIYAADIAASRTQYTLAQRLLREAIDETVRLSLPKDEVSCYGLMAHVLGELHDFDGAIAYGERAFQRAKDTDNLRSASGALINLGHIYGQLLRFDDAVSRFQQAFDIATAIEFEGQRKVAAASLAHYWGLFGCSVGEEVLEVAAKKSPVIGYMAYIEAYSEFGLAVGQGDADAAQRAAVSMLRQTSEQGQDRMFYVALDDAAIAVAMAERQEDAAVLVRLGTRFRRHFLSGRSPVEKLVVRKHAPGPYFSARIRERFEAMPVSEPRQLAEQIEQLMQ